LDCLGSGGVFVAVDKVVLVFIFRLTAGTEGDGWVFDDDDSILLSSERLFVVDELDVGCVVW
jgi:hypothetical protein